MLDALACLLCQKLYWYNQRKPTGQAMTEPMYVFLTTPTMFKIVTLLYFQCQHPVLHYQYWPMFCYCCINPAQVLSYY